MFYYFKMNHDVLSIIYIIVFYLQNEMDMDNLRGLPNAIFFYAMERTLACTTYLPPLLLLPPCPSPSLLVSSLCCFIRNKEKVLTR